MQGQKNLWEQVYGQKQYQETLRHDAARAIRTASKVTGVPEHSKDKLPLPKQMRRPIPYEAVQGNQWTREKIEIPQSVKDAKHAYTVGDATVGVARVAKEKAAIVLER